jgi:hypothetical protein
MTNSTPIQLLRSQAFQQRPNPALLLSGQPAVNINEFEPGLFFADAADNLFKVGPTAVGPTPPNGNTGGSGAALNLVGSVSCASVSSGGTGYAVNDVLTVTGGSGTSSILTVATVSSGVITSVNVTNAGSYTTFPVSPVNVTGGSGSGATFNLTGGVISATISFGGSGYTVGDFLIVSGGSGVPATLEVTAASGASITSVSVLSPGNYSIFPVSPVITVEGSGGSNGNSVGEQWLDTSNPNAPGLLVYDGTRWRGITPISNTLWVDVNGDNSNDGTSPQTAKQTIKAALALATAGTQIRVASGNYNEQNPLIFPFPDISIVGADLRSTTITLLNDDDLFQVLNGCYVQNFSFLGSVTKTPNPLNPTELIQTKGIMSYWPTGSGVITQSPYVQNCTNFVENSIGLNVDGSKAGGLKSMVLDSFTQYNPDGVGVKVYNRGYCQVVSMFTICADKSVLAETGGLVSVTNSNSDFGNFGMYADGTGPLEQSGLLVSSTVNNSVFALNTLTTGQVPYVGQVITVGDLYYNVSSFEITNPGSGYTSLPTVSVSIGTGPNAIAAQGIAIIDGGQLIGIEVASSGQNYTDTDVITVSITGGGGASAAAIAVKNPVYYTVAGVTETFTGVGGTVSIAILENLPYNPSPGDTVNFWRVSRIIANSHCMEYVGSGIDINTAIPFSGGTAIQANEVIQINGGRVAVTSTDQLGDFRVGEDLVINQNTGTISGQAFRKSILAIVIPYILALS